MPDRQFSDAWRSLNTTKRDILTVLAMHGPATGTEIHLRLFADIDNAATTHRNLTALEQTGYIRQEVNTDDERERVNHLTLDGLERVREGVLEPASVIDAREESLVESNAGP